MIGVRLKTCQDLQCDLDRLDIETVFTIYNKPITPLPHLSLRYELSLALRADETAAGRHRMLT
jgi:hypothetical protein